MIVEQKSIQVNEEEIIELQNGLLSHLKNVFKARLG